jgi:CheY-like chemotaxis protein
MLPQLLLLDLHLPKVSGLEILARLRADRRTATLPVAVLTVSDHERDIQACRDLGVEHYILKPVTAAALGHVVVTSGLGWALIRSALPETAVPVRT